MLKPTTKIVEVNSGDVTFYHVKIVETDEIVGQLLPTLAKAEELKAKIDSGEIRVISLDKWLDQPENGALARFVSTFKIR